jgi:hypothetical protein
VCELLRQLGPDDCRTRATFVSAAVEAVVEFKGIQSVVDDLFDHFPDGLK